MVICLGTSPPSQIRNFMGFAPPSAPELKVRKLFGRSPYYIPLLGRGGQEGLDI